MWMGAGGLIRNRVCAGHVGDLITGYITWIIGLSHDEMYSKENKVSATHRRAAHGLIVK
jgi:hypothetical protein